MSSPRLKLKSGVDVVWGTSSVAITGYGIVRNASRKRGSEKEKIADENGFTCGVVYFDHTDEVELEISCKSVMTPPTIGDDFAVFGLTGQVQDYSFKWDYKGVKVFTVSVTKWDGMV